MGEEQQASRRTIIAIGGERYILAAEEEIEDLKSRIEDAVRAGGQFVDFATERCAMSVLITVRSAVAIIRDVEVAPYIADADPPALPDF